MEELREKVFYEYERYKALKMIGSRESIYSEAAQVAMMKRIRDTIISMRFTEEELFVLNTTLNLLDKIHLKCIDSESLRVTDIKRQINMFLKETMNNGIG